MKFKDPPARFQQIGLYSSTASVERPVPLGGLYQARLLSSGGNLIGELSFPGLKPKGGRANFCTRCAEVPQVEITPGGTFVSVVCATSVPTRARIQLGVNPPTERGDEFPAFAPEDVVATAVSDEPKLMHKLELVDRLRDPETGGHAPLQPGQELFFVILAWDELGNWDYVWDPERPAPGNDATSFMTKTRTVDLRIKRLFCIDDSDSATFGDGYFEFIVVDSTGFEHGKTLDWVPMETGTDHAGPAAPTEMRLSGDKAKDSVTVRVFGSEDDQGLGFDYDDEALAGPDHGEPLTFPVGQARELVRNMVLTLNSHFTSGDDVLRFFADIEYSVTYN
ncbi:hypothetical protein OH782_42355 (plasmid) [Streptomyces sp. NBC_01544]|uniref:hypothetical protein n=1 Tax=Streptomyces sp. NBC_01544 TaxID=2975871 RepID=UPI003865E8A0